MVSVTDKTTGSSSKDPLDTAQWLQTIAAQRSPQEFELIRRACELAQNAHVGQQRASGEPYFQHALAVANILAELRMDHETLAAALLHDVVEDTTVSNHDIEQQFGRSVARLVDGVTKMDMIQNFQTVDLEGKHEQGKKEKRHTEALRKMLLAMADDIRVVLIKLADRLHNMRTLSALPPDKQIRIAQETIDIYAPLANRLGIWQMKWELEDLAFRYLHADLYKQMARMVNERRIDRERYIDEFMQTVEKELLKAGLQARVMGRPKHIYSIWRKMQRKNLDYNQIYDIRAVRIIVDEVRDCYAALGIVHSLWQFIPGEFDDYIATPKENNYRSIHTAVIGPGGRTVEIQIRTQEMHQLSELGVAAHWRYKEGGGHDPALERKITLLRQLIEWKEDLAASGDFEEELRADLFQDRVYVFSPKGDIVDLPKGATPLDYAYHVHTELGHRCRGAKVNGMMVPLTYTLQTGQQVDIITVKRGDPSRDWLNPHLGFLKTSRARGKVQHWFKQQNLEANITAGRLALEREFQRLGLTGINFEELARRLNYGKLEDFLAAVGRNDLKTGQVVNLLQEAPEPRLKQDMLARPALAPGPKRSGGDVQILGVGNLMTQLARCCKPVAGDEIMGYITRGRGITIHRRDCPNILRHLSDSAQRLIEVEWGSGIDTYPVNLRITAFDRQGLLRDITSVLANEKINVIAVQTLSNKQDHIANMTLTVEIADISALSRILSKISQLPNIIEAKREVH